MKVDVAPKAQLGQIALLEAHFAHRGDPFTLPAETKQKPQSVSVEISGTTFAENGAIVIRVRVGSNPSEEGVLYDFSVLMGGILVRTPATPKEWNELDFAKIGVGMLFPFIREVVANVTGRGRFGPVWLNPLNIREVFDDADLSAIEAAR